MSLPVLLILVYLDLPSVMFFVFTLALAAVEALINSGCHPSKIIMGLPAYGRDKFDPSNVKTYSEVFDNFKVESYEDTSSILEKSNFGFDTQALILKKVEKGFQMKLGGIFIWEIGQDFKNDFVEEGLMLSYVNNAISHLRGDGVGKEL